MSLSFFSETSQRVGILNARVWLANRAFVNRSSFLQYELQSEKFFRAFRNKAEKSKLAELKDYTSVLRI